jgi:hypothetical protein
VTRPRIVTAPNVVMEQTWLAPATKAPLPQSVSYVSAASAATSSPALIVSVTAEPTCTFAVAGARVNVAVGFTLLIVAVPLVVCEPPKPSVTVSETA